LHERSATTSFGDPSPAEGGSRMAWKAPKIVEVALGGEINSYVCVRLK
jgi:coenzyme PQQ precursor peptide PqqA